MQALSYVLVQIFALVAGVDICKGPMSCIYIYIYIQSHSYLLSQILPSKFYYILSYLIIFHCLPDNLPHNATGGFNYDSIMFHPKDACYDIPLARNVHSWHLLHPCSIELCSCRLIGVPNNGFEDVSLYCKSRCRTSV